MALTPEQQSFISTCRLKATANLITLDEMKRCIIILRESRKGALDAAAASGVKRTKAKPSEAAIGDMLADLEAM